MGDFLESRYHNRLFVRLVISSWGSQIRSACQVRRLLSTPFCGSTFRSGGWNSGPGMDPSSGKIKLCVEDYSSRLEGRITGDKGKLSGGCYFRHIGFLVRTWRTRLRKPLSLNGVMFGQIGRRPLRVPCFATAGTSKRILRSITPKSSP